MLSFLNNNTLPRGLRNNNPGNLIYTGLTWQGKIPFAQNTDWKNNPANVVKEFEQFTSVNYGIRAMAMDLLNDIAEGTNTLRKLITEYAPPSENNTAAYINWIANQTGINPDAPLQLNAQLLAYIIKAQIEMENGAQAASLISLDEIYNSIRLMPSVILKQLGDVVTANPAKTFLLLALAGGAVYGLYKLIRRS